MNFNWAVLPFWVVCAGLGWLMGDLRGAVIGLVAACAASFLATLVQR